MSSLLKYIKENVSAEEYYSWQFPEIRWSVGSDEARVMSPFLVEEAPSFSVNRKSGAWHSFCAADERGGRTIISYHAAAHEISYQEAALQIYHKLVHPIISEKVVEGYATELRKTKSILGYLKKRQISREVIIEYQLGWDGDRIAIPIRSEFGFCINIKLYSPSKKKNVVKMINYMLDGETRSYGSPTMLYPIQVMEKAKIVVICEGEWDVLTLLSLGIAAVTTTAGANSWPKQYNYMFENRKVIIAPDNDSAGQAYVNVVTKNLRHSVRVLAQLEIPKKHAKDVNDLVCKNPNSRSKKFWMKLIRSANNILTNSRKDIDSNKVSLVSLDKASEAQWYNEPIEVDALITGKAQPYIVPYKYRISCAEACEDCILTKRCEEIIDNELDTTDADTLKMVDLPDNRLRKLLLQKAGIHESPCIATIEILETFNIEFLLLIPSLDSKSTQYVTTTGYFVGHGLSSNKTYRFEGKSLPHPKTQIATLLLNEAHPAQNQIETFELTDKIKSDLKRFQPRNLKLFAHLMSISDWQSKNITKIHSRPDLHIAVDLVFHSPHKFIFNNEDVPRAMLDVLVIGDTRCGKGYVAERLMRYYGVGEMASGENCSFAGLVGGVQQISGRWFITWGMIPLNNNRLVVIDEVSSMSESDIGHMSRVRSEGVAEISKIVRESTQANTRLLWLSNPRSGRPIMTYNCGVEAIRELMGANEDVSRFDFAMTVASDEVDTELINAKVDYKITLSEYPQQSCRNLILWSWSRTTEQIKFTPNATSEVIKTAIEFGKKYSSAIPLVQSENIRIKLAKISAAIAARTYSTDKTGERLIITGEHVRCAAQFLRLIYSKPSMKYDTYSNSTLRVVKDDDPSTLLKVFKKMGADQQFAIKGLLEIYKVTADNLADYVGDSISAKMLISDLVKLGYMARHETGKWYMKTPLLNTWLRKELNDDGKM